MVWDTKKVNSSSVHNLWEEYVACKSWKVGDGKKLGGAIAAWMAHGGLGRWHALTQATG